MPEGTEFGEITPGETLFGGETGSSQPAFASSSVANRGASVNITNRGASARITAPGASSTITGNEE